MPWLSELVVLTSFPFQGFDWKSLNQDALVVDIGGGVGPSTLMLLNAYSYLCYVVKDLPKVIPDSVKIHSNVKYFHLYLLNG